MRWSGRPLEDTRGSNVPEPPGPGRERLRHELSDDVHALAGQIGERHLGRHAALLASARFIERRFAEAGYSRIDHQRFEVDGLACENLAIEVPGDARTDEVVIVGAHYDSAIGSPGANDNATGVASMLCLARRWAGRTASGPKLRFVAFTNEEVSHAREQTMGSVRYAQRCRRRNERIAAMIALETMGYYSDVPGSQSYPLPMPPLYPRTGSFIGFVGNLGSVRLVRRSVSAFRRHSAFPCRSAVLPAWVPGVGWSDHAAFWAEGYRAIMVTDTAAFRYPHYHRPSDTPDKVDYDRLARVVEGLIGVVEDAVG